MASIMAVLTNPSVFHPLLTLKKAEKLTQGERYCGFRYSKLRHTGSTLKAMLKPSNDFYEPLSKLKVAEKHIPADDPHLGFCYSMLPKLSTNLSVLILDLDTHSRDLACILFMFLVAIDVVEDDTSIANEIKMPILRSFHRHIYNRDWYFSGGTKEYKVLMDNFYHVSSAFINLYKSYQEIIGDTVMRMGLVMAKYICNKVETIDDYEEYCFHVSGLFVIGSTKLFHASQGEVLLPESLSKHIGFLFQKTNITRDYLEDINEVPKSRMIWPREIWSKYANNLEDFKCEKNSEKAVQCLNEMVTDALIHVDGCFQYMSQLRDPAIFRYWAIPQVLAFGTLSLCYNNIQVFRRGVKMDPRLRAIVFDRTSTMTDVYGAFHDFSYVLKSKIDINDPNAETTTSRIEAIQKICRDSGALEEWKSYVVEIEPTSTINV